jgi:hypothetical protein
VKIERFVVAKKTIVTLIDDIDGSTAEESIQFSFEGASYEIDLSTENAAAFRSAMKPYLDASRKATSRRPRRSASSTAASPKDVRAWAAENGIAVPARGRIPAEVQDQYRAAIG